jgi:hypothetical protein
MQEDTLWRRFLDLFSPHDGASTESMVGLVLFGVSALVGLLLLAWLARALLARRKRKGDSGSRELEIDLDRCPLPVGPPGVRRLTVYHLPVRLRLVVLAPVGKTGDVDVTAVEKLLDRVLPGLGEVAIDDRPCIRVWPPQISQHGFSAAFHRHTPRAAGRGEPSRWVLVAGRAEVGRQRVMVGLGLWADEPNTIGRVTLGPHQWLDVLRLQHSEG